MVRVRFAPSPTGLLHIGGARTALFNYLFARQQGGKFVLRIEDTDKERSTKENEEEIVASLKWLGLSWDEGVGSSDETSHGPYRQSERVSQHMEFLEMLKSSSSAYTDNEGCVRLKYPDEDIVVQDMICGDCRFAPNSLGPDPVIMRSDGTPTFHLANVADDIHMKITHIIRGQDHLTNSAKHVVLFRAAGVEVPRFAHLPLLLGEDGSKLSKRNLTGFTTVQDFREKGFLPEALLNFINLLGWSHPESKDIFDIDEAVRLFSLERVNTTGAKFELSKLDWFNGQYLRSIDEERLAELTLPWLADWRGEIERRGRSYWSTTISALKTDILRLTDVERLGQLLCAEVIEPNEEARAFIEGAESRDVFLSVRAKLREVVLEFFPTEGSDSYSQEEIKHLLKVVRKGVDAPPKLIFQSSRIIFTGALKGAELDLLLPFVPRQILVSRIGS